MRLEVASGQLHHQDYSALHARSKTQFDSFVAEGKALSKYSSVLALLLQLRQACDHPFLVQSRADFETPRVVARSEPLQQ